LQAVVGILWADGRAMMPVCQDHIKAGNAFLGKFNGAWAEIIGTRKLPESDEQGVEWWHRDSHGKGWHKKRYPTKYKAKKEDLEHEIEKTSSKMPIIKTKEEQFVLGIVLEPNDGHDGAPLDPDSQNDIYSKEEIRRSAHKFMANFKHIGLSHRTIINGKVQILETYLAPVDFFVAKNGDAFQCSVKGQAMSKVRQGTWLLGLKITDSTLWGKIKNDELTGLSIGGSAERVDVNS